MSHCKETTRELERSLRSHLTNLEDILNHPNVASTNRYLLLAGILRVLLYDKETPVLLTYCALKNITPHIWAQNTPPENVFKKIVSGGHFYPVSGRPPHQGQGYKNLPIQEYLSSKIGVTDDPKDHLQGVLYSGADLIKWIANKEGMSHLSVKKPNAIVDLRKTKAVGIIYVTDQMSSSGWTLENHHEDPRFAGIPIDMFPARVTLIALGEWALKTIKCALSYSKYVELNGCCGQSHIKSIPPLGKDPIVDAVIHKRYCFSVEIDSLVQEICRWIEFSEAWNHIPGLGNWTLSKYQLELEILLSKLENVQIPNQKKNPEDYPVPSHFFYTQG